MTAVLLAALLAMTPDEKEIDEAIERFTTAMKSREPEVRVQAVLALGRIQHERTVRALETCLLADEKKVRIAAANALSGFREKKARIVAILGEALNGNAKEPEVMVAILLALRDLRDASALPIAYRYLDHKNAKVAQSAITVTEAIRSRDSIDPLIKLMKRLIGAGDGIAGGGAGGYDVPPDEMQKERARLLEAAGQKALEAITGERLTGPKEWDAWWKKNSTSFRIKE